MVYAHRFTKPSYIVLGFLTVLLSSIIFTFQNIIVRVLFTEQLVFGVFLLGGYVPPTLHNSFLLLFMRMLVVVPLMAILASSLYPQAWTEIRKLARLEYRPVAIQAIACGLLMFTYVSMLYFSLGLIPTGISMTLFFTYPMFTALFSWQMYGDRPTPFRWGIMGIILLGSALTMPHSNGASSNAFLGILLSVLSGVVYALYTVIAQKCFEKLHPVPFTWISFAITLLLSGLSLLIWQVPSTPLPWTPLWIGGLLSGVITFAAHSLNNLGIRMVGATAAAMLGSSTLRRKLSYTY